MLGNERPRPDMTSRFDDDRLVADAKGCSSRCHARPVISTFARAQPTVASTSVTRRGGRIAGDVAADPGRLEWLAKAASASTTRAALRAGGTASSARLHRQGSRPPSVVFLRSFSWGHSPSRLDRRVRRKLTRDPRSGRPGRDPATRRSRIDTRLDALRDLRPRQGAGARQPGYTGARGVSPGCSPVASRRGSGALRARSRGCARRARACWREPRGRAGAVSGRQAGSGIARSRASAAASCPAQGQRFGRCRVQRRAEWVSRPARAEVAPPERPGAVTMPSPSPSRAVQRARLCAITCTASQAAFKRRSGPRGDG